MTNAELADLIRELFTPFAMTCDCNGSHSECQTALEDPAVWAQYKTTSRIADYIRRLND